MSDNVRSGDTFIKDGDEYVVLATKEIPEHYVIPQGKDFVASRSFSVQVVSLSYIEMEGINIQHNT